VFWMHGEPDKIARDTMFKGTALAAPISNFLIHATLTAVVARRPSRRTQQALGGLGILLIAGYLGERHVRQRLRPSSWDALESLLLVAAIGLAAGMAVLGLRPSPPKATSGRSMVAFYRWRSTYLSIWPRSQSLPNSPVTPNMATPIIRTIRPAPNTSP
jgi:hypothetical protein